MKDFDKDIKRFAQIIKEGNAVFLGGAGVSTQSGIPDFRSADGLYFQKYDYPPEQILSARFFATHTAEFYKFYKDRMLPLDAKPNAAHYVLAELEKKGLIDAVITQNIDGLHQSAGSKRVLELHGTIHKNRCMRCGKVFDAHYIAQSEGIPHCDCGGIIKPEVVLYGEPLPEDVFQAAERLVSRANTVIVGGTSLSVYPAAGLLYRFSGENLILINKTKLSIEDSCTLSFDQPIADVFQKLRTLL